MSELSSNWDQFHCVSMDRVRPLSSMREAAEKVPVESDLPAVVKMNAYWFRTERIIFEDGFNVRELDRERIEDFKFSFRNGVPIPPILGRPVLLDDDPVPYFLAREGHHRKVMYQELGEEVVEVTDTQNKQECAARNLLIMYKTNPDLSLIAKSIIYRRLMQLTNPLDNKPFTNSSVARYLGVSPTAVTNFSYVSQMPMELVDYIRDGKVSSTVAIEFFRKERDNAVSVLEQLVSSKNNDVVPDLNPASPAGGATLCEIQGGDEQAIALPSDDGAIDGVISGAEKKPKLRVTAKDLKSKRPQLSSDFGIKATSVIRSIFDRLDVKPSDGGDVLLRIDSETYLDIKRLADEITRFQEEIAKSEAVDAD